MPVNNIDQGAAKDQPHNVMTGSQDNDISGVDLHIDSPTLELGPLHVLQYVVKRGLLPKKVSN